MWHWFQLNFMFIHMTFVLESLNNVTPIVVTVSFPNTHHFSHLHVINTTCSMWVGWLISKWEQIKIVNAEIRFLIQNKDITDIFHFYGSKQHQLGSLVFRCSHKNSRRTICWSLWPSNVVYCETQGIDVASLLLHIIRSSTVIPRSFKCILDERTFV